MIINIYKALFQLTLALTILALTSKAIYNLLSIY